MKKLFISLTVALFALISVNAQTNTPSLTSTNPISLSLSNAISGKTAGGWELTLGGGGENVKGGTASVGLDVSLSTNPFETRPEVWLGLSQSVFWEPIFSGSTDLFVDWSQALYKDDLYINIGWSGGLLYDAQGSDVIWRTGPEATLQYYTSENAFVYAGVNYDIYRSDRLEGDFRFSFGIGLSF